MAAVVNAPIICRTPVWTPGLDVSHYQGEIDWPSVAAAGYKFVYVKCSEGATYCDPDFRRNASSARSAGLLVGAYHFLTAADWQTQLAWFQKMQEGAPTGLPPALDVEEAVPASNVLQWLGAMWEARLAHAPEIARPPLLYCDPAYAASLTRAEPALQNYPLWIAEYGVAGPRIAPWVQWDLWQHA